MKTHILKVLVEINEELQFPHGNYSLMSGLGGINLYEYFYHKHFNSSVYDNNFVHSLNLLIENSLDFQHSTFSGGKSGVNWFFSFLFKEGILRKRDWLLLTSDDRILLFSALEYLKNKNYDFLHGALGIAHYLKYLKGAQFNDFFYDFFDLLNSLPLNVGDMLPFYNLQTNTINNDMINIGFAHGIVSVLKFCIDCFKSRISPLQAQILAERIIFFLRNHHSNDIRGSYYPSYLEKNRRKSNNSFSRMGWCYGDLIIGYTLFEAGLAFRNSEIQTFATEILNHTTKRKGFNSTNVDNSAICHGSAGIAHIYNKLYHKTGSEVFLDSCKYWIEETLQFYAPKDTLADNIYNSKDRRNSNPGLLTGNAGVGLVLLSYLTNDFSWDYCLMLN